MGFYMNYFASSKSTKIFCDNFLVLCQMAETQYKKAIYMADNLTKEQRHKNMKNIHGKDTKIEIILRKALWAKGYRYRKNYKKLPGNPDIVLT